jgi:hypothetical protein
MELRAGRLKSSLLLTPQVIFSFFLSLPSFFVTTKCRKYEYLFDGSTQEVKRDVHQVDKRYPQHQDWNHGVWYEEEKGEGEEENKRRMKTKYFIFIR